MIPEYKSSSDRENNIMKQTCLKCAVEIYPKFANTRTLVTEDQFDEILKEIERLTRGFYKILIDVK